MLFLFIFLAPFISAFTLYDFSSLSTVNYCYSKDPVMNYVMNKSLPTLPIFF